MKLQYLIIIFLLIMTPIYVVFSKYIDVQIDNIKIQNTYDSKLRNATYDAVKSFQTNTINSFRNSPETRVKFSKAAVNSFYTSLNLAFGFNGETNSLMNEYVPAVVLTMYDGYYIYSPFVNKVTDVDDEQIDEEYADGKTISDLKPFISYSCNYTKNSKNYIITYSLDNYILVDEFDGSNHKRHEGYLIGLNQYTDVRGDLDYEHPEKITSYTFNGIQFSANNKKELLREYLIDKEGNGDFYYYTLRNGSKYYFGTTDNKGNIIGPGDLSSIDETKDVVFYMDDSGARMIQCSNYKDNQQYFLSYYNEIKENRLSFEYYRDAYVFSKWAKENLNGIGTENIKNSENYNNYPFKYVDNIFEEIESNTQYIEDSDSKFNQHRREIIRAVIQTNLASAISGFSTYSKAKGSINFIMPKISEEDWDLLENNICIVTFLQGFPIGSSIYNGYAVAPNSKTKEFVDENDIYVLKNDKTYAKINEKNLLLEDKNSLGFYPGIWKINFELKSLGGKAYIPMCYAKGKAYLESYSSMIGTDLELINNSEMYKYIRQKGNSDNDKIIKETFYVALGRERKGTFKFTNYGD